MLARLLRHGSASPGAWSEARIDSVWEHFDQGTQRAILRLHRSVDEHWLAAAGEGMRRLEQPALVVWGEQDPWLDPSFAEAYGRRLPGATVERIPGAGHWPWLDRPELTARLGAFVAGPPAT
jgi:pimeloyl-ACP methyl ester carboxylesterase